MAFLDQTGLEHLCSRIATKINTIDDTKVKQTTTTSNANYPLLLAPSGQTATTTTTSYFDSGVTLNPSTNTIAANISGTAVKATQDANGNEIASTYLPLSGGTVTGSFIIKNSSTLPAIQLISSSYSYGSTIYYSIPTSSTTSQLCFRVYSRSSSTYAPNSYYETYSLPSVNADRTTTASYSILTSKSPVTIAQGGTGATSPEEARANLDITPVNIGAAASNHTHSYAGSSSAGGAATSANKVNTNLVIKLNGGSTEGTNLFTFNGSAAKTINVTASSIGAATSSHTHSEYATSSHTHSEYLPLAGGTMTGAIITPGDDSAVIRPSKNNYDTIGSTSYYFYKMYSTNYYLGSGTADMASGTLKIKTISAPTSSGGSTYGKGDSGQALLSNGSTVYWGTVSGGSTYSAGNGLSLSGTTFSVSYGTSASALGTSSAGSATTVSRSDHVHALPALTSCTGTLTIAKGGTGLTASPSMLVNLGSTSTANILVASPRPGVTGTLPITNGGTGSTSKSGARTNLGITSGTSLPSSGSAGDIFFLY